MIRSALKFFVWLLQPVFRLWPKSQFACALILAGGDELLTKAKGIKSALQTKPEISDNVRLMRAAFCSACPMFWKPGGTCGTPLIKLPGKTFRGCYCHCETICGVEHNCAAFDFFRGRSELGWPRELNSFPDIYD